MEEGESKSRRGSRERIRLFAAVAAQGELPGTDLGVVLCEFDKGFKGLLISD